VKLIFSRRSWAHYFYWQDEDAKIVARINAVLEDCRRHPFQGIGKPEPLGGNLAGWWSRRINSEHRLVYRVSRNGDTLALEVAQCRFHY